MGKSIVFVNQKGGVGKTTSAINIGAYIALAGKKVLLVDFDSQGNMSSGVGVSKDKPTVYELIAGLVEPKDAVKHTPVENLDAISASIDLSGAAIELVDQDEREFFLKKALAPLKDDYDYILIDCPPSLGLLTLNGLAAADSVLVPMQCEYFALEGITLLLQTVQNVQKKINPELSIGGIFFTMYELVLHRMLLFRLSHILRMLFLIQLFQEMFVCQKHHLMDFQFVNTILLVLVPRVMKNLQKR